MSALREDSVNCRHPRCRGANVLDKRVSRALTMSQEMHHGGSVVVKEVPVIKEVIKEVRVEVPKVVYVPVEVIKEVREAEGTA